MRLLGENNRRKCFYCKESCDEDNKCINKNCSWFGRILYTRKELEKMLEDKNDPVKIDDEMFNNIKRRMELSKIGKKWR